MALGTEVKYFHSGMPGAPALTAAAGSLIAVLDACLANGFGLKSVDSLVVENGVATATISTGHSAREYAVVLIEGATPVELNGEKRVVSTSTNTVVFDAAGIANQTATGTITLKLAPAGWGKKFSETNKAAYQSLNVASTRCYFQFDDTAQYQARVRGYESMTDVDTGTGLFPTDSQVSGGMFMSKANNTSGARDWFVVANAGFVYLGVAFLVANPEVGYLVYGFGDIPSRKSGDAYRAVLRCGKDSHYTVNPASVSVHAKGVFFLAGTPDVNTYFARDYTGMGGSAAGAPVSFPSVDSVAAQSVTGTGTVQYPNGPDYGLDLIPIQMAEKDTKAIRGVFPGLTGTPQSATGRIAAGARVGSFLTSVPDMPDRVIAVIPTFCGTSGTFAPGFIDIIGPWGN